MKVVRFAGIAVVVFALGALILGGPSVSGQQPAPELPRVQEVIPVQAPPATYYAVNNPYKIHGRDPEMLKIMAQEAQSEREAAGLIKEYGRTENEGQRDKIKTKLSEVLGKEFDLQQKRRDLELARLEAQVKKLRDLMKKRSDARQTIVEKRLDQLIREADGLGWTTPPGAAAPNTPNNFAPFILPQAPVSQPPPGAR